MISAGASHVTAILSMLHEAPDPGANSATRRFRGAPVLQWTLERIGRARHVKSVAVLCWEDQLPGVVSVAGDERAYVLAKGPRVPVPEVEAVDAARRWADGWRGGLLSTCHFDLGFHGPWYRELAEKLGSDAILLVEPSAGLVDPVLLDRLVEQAAEHEETDLLFCPAAPGLAGALVRRSLLNRLAASRTHPGRLLHYLPDQTCREPLAGDACVPVATLVARTTHRFTLDSERQIARIEAATVSLNGELIGSEAETIAQRLQSSGGHDPLPREVVLELNTSRASRPTYWPGRHLAIERQSLATQTAAALFDELKDADDLRLTLGGVGDPMLSANFFDVIDAAAQRNVSSIQVETDLLDIPPEYVARLARSPVDVVSVHLPALTPQTYEAVMGVNAYAAALESIRRFVTERQSARGRLPLLVPVFTKCARNLAEMEPWYDQWLRALGSAVIAGPGDYAGQIPDASVADMAPAKRSACARLASRMTVLCDGRVVSCEQDVLGRHTLGEIGKQPLAQIWQRSIGALRTDHQQGNWAKHALCTRCRDWHRP